jgi:hypothetical protein
MTWLPKACKAVAATAEMLAWGGPALSRYFGDELDRRGTFPRAASLFLVDSSEPLRSSVLSISPRDSEELCADEVGD